MCDECPKILIQDFFFEQVKQILVMMRGWKLDKNITTELV